jgi:hypothetical protein
MPWARAAGDANGKPANCLYENQFEPASRETPPHPPHCGLPRGLTTVEDAADGDPSPRGSSLSLLIGMGMRGLSVLMRELAVFASSLGMMLRLFVLAERMVMVGLVVVMRGGVVVTGGGVVVL